MAFSNFFSFSFLRFGFVLFAFLCFFFVMFSLFISPYFLFCYSIAKGLAISWLGWVIIAKQMHILVINSNVLRPFK